VSRQLLKKFAAEKYKLAPTAANIAHLNHAITHGAEKGIFLLPKGVSYICLIASIPIDVVS
jgi:histone H1/5